MKIQKVTLLYNNRIVYEVSRKPLPTEEKGTLDQGAVDCHICGKVTYQSERVVANKWVLNMQLIDVIDVDHAQELL